MSEKEIYYWKIAPGRHGNLWAEQRDSNCISIGWNDVGNLKKYSSDEKIKQKFKNLGYPSRPFQLLKFYHNVSRGDKIIASSGKKIYGIGTVMGNYKYDENLEYAHSKPVKWEVTFWEPLDVDEIRLSNETKSKLQKNRTIIRLSEHEGKKIERELFEVTSPFKNLNGWEGLPRAPETEQEVIILFSKLSQILKMKIEYVSTRFPDAYVRVKKGSKWETKSAEFEINSSSFKNHGHLQQMKNDNMECSMIICWRDDWNERPKDIKVVELRKEMMKIL